MENSSVDINCREINKNFLKVETLKFALVDYISAAQEQVGKLTQREMERFAGSGQKQGLRAQILACLIREHPFADSVTVTKSGAGISVYDRQNERWLNILVKTK